MELRDFIVTPIVFIVLMMFLFWIKPRVVAAETRIFFFPAILLKFFGALSIGLVYQFYYGGGDTFGFTTYGSSYIWEAFIHQPITAFKLIFFNNEYLPETYKYAIRMWYFDDKPTYFVVRIAGLLSLLTFNTYSSIALIFAIIGFSGLWAFYSKLVEIYPKLRTQLFIAFFTIPSVIFWGSGVMKDTITLSALGWAGYAIFSIFFHKKRVLSGVIILFLSLTVISIVKVYILFCFLPAACIMIFLNYVKSMKSQMLKIMIKPFLFLLALGISFYGVISIGSNDNKYSMDNILQTAEITAKDNSMWTVRSEGSGYSLGDYDFSPEGLARKFIPAVWLTIYRPYLWESNSMVMFLSALESTILLFFTLTIFFTSGPISFIINLFNKPIVGLFMIFTISFAFAVGISSGNFGSLVRYKIPIMPLYISSLFILQFYSKQGESRNIIQLNN